jgi:hypothetical protein
MFFSASNNNGNPLFYVEFYKYNNDGFTFISDSSATPEFITNGVSIDLYTTSLAVPLTTLTTSDRLAVRLVVNTDGNRTVTLHTQNSHLCEIQTTFSNGLLTLNGLSSQIQYFAVGTNNGTTFSIVSSGNTHTFNSAKDIYVTGGTYSNGTSIFTNNTGGTFNVTGFTTPFTGGTVSGETNFTNGLTANTISATTYYNLPVVSGNSINVITGNTNAGSVVSTNYIYLASNTITITLPTAVGNTNLYTIKNKGTGVVTINTTSSQTIDGSLTAPINLQYLSLTLVSDGANWNIT